MALDIPAASAALQELYIGQDVENLALVDRAAFAIMPKMEKFVGANYPLPNVYAKPAGGSSQFGIAYNASSTGPSLGRFSLTRKNYFYIGFISGEAMEAGDGDIGSFVELAKLELDTVYQACADRAAWQIYRSGTGSQGQISSVYPTSPLTAGQLQLTNVSDAMMFEVGQAVQANATDGGATPNANVGFVVAIDRDQSIITFATVANGSPALPSGWAVGNFLLNNGDNGQDISGMMGWVPPTAPVVGDNWYGLDRSKDVSRLAGVRFPGAGLSIRDALIQGASKVVDNGGKPKHCFLHTNAWAALATALEGNVLYGTKEAFKAPQISFPTIKLMTPKGECEIIGDMWAPASYAFMNTMDTWELASIGKVPKVLDYGDQVKNYLRVGGQDAAEVRFGFRGNVGNKAPGRSGIISITY